MAIHEILEEIMKEKGVSIADIARICNLPDSTVRGIIKRKQDTIALDVAFKLSDGLDVSLEKLNGMPEREESMIKNSPSARGPAPGEEIQQEIIRLAGKLRPDQQNFLLAILQLTVARNQGLPAADLVSDREAVLKSELQRQTQ